MYTLIHVGRENIQAPNMTCVCNASTFQCPLWPTGMVRFPSGCVSRGPVLSIWVIERAGGRFLGRALSTS